MKCALKLAYPLSSDTPYREFKRISIDLLNGHPDPVVSEPGVGLGESTFEHKQNFTFQRKNY